MSSSTPDRVDPRANSRDDLARRNARMAWLHVLLAATFVATFVIMQAFR